MEMSPPTNRTFQIYELTERIILEVDDPVEIIRAQRVCHTWKDIIQTSPALQNACWYQSPSVRNSQTPSTSSHQTQGWKLNPAFNRIGVRISQDTGDWPHEVDGYEEMGDFNLQERIYDKPGSWATMLATQPPCQRVCIHCYGDYSGDETMWYLIASMAGPLLMGDVMAVLAECQNRQEYGLDRWAGVRHYTGRVRRWTTVDWDDCGWSTIDILPNDVSIKVAVEIPWGGPQCNAFSLRRIDGTGGFLHEMILHKMTTVYGKEYQWKHGHHGGKPGRPVCKTGNYKANLLAVRDYQDKYLSDCSHIFRLLSDVKQ